MICTLSTSSWTVCNHCLSPLVLKVPLEWSLFPPCSSRAVLGLRPLMFSGLIGDISFSPLSRDSFVSCCTLRLLYIISVSPPGVFLSASLWPFLSLLENTVHSPASAVASPSFPAVVPSSRSFTSFSTLSGIVPFQFSSSIQAFPSPMLYHCLAEGWPHAFAHPLVFS